LTLGHRRVAAARHRRELARTLDFDHATREPVLHRLALTARLPLAVSPVQSVTEGLLALPDPPLELVLHANRNHLLPSYFACPIHALGLSTPVIRFASRNSDCESL